MRVQNINTSNGVGQVKSNNNPNFGMKIYVPEEAVKLFKTDVAQEAVKITDENDKNNFLKLAYTFLVDFGEKIAQHNTNAQNHTPYGDDIIIKKISANLESCKTISKIDDIKIHIESDAFKTDRNPVQTVFSFTSFSINGTTDLVRSIQDIAIASKNYGERIKHVFSLIAPH